MVKKITVITLLILLPSLCFAFKGKCVKVEDGNTITVSTDSKQVKVILYGIDCPEKKQSFANKATGFTKSLVAKKLVTVKILDKDRYGRVVGIVYSESACLNEELLKNGYAWVFGKYCKELFCRQWKGLEQQARADKKGLWSDPYPVKPWVFRIGRGPMGQNLATTKYHGNIKTHKFHKVGCRHYNDKNCIVSFTTRQEAIRRGYTGCRICRP